MSYAALAQVHTSEPPVVRRSTLVRVGASLVGGALGGALWSGHEILGGLAVAALARNIADVAQREKNWSGALGDLKPHAMATAGALAIQPAPLGYIVGALASGLAVGATESTEKTVHAYTDADTVTKVQQFLRGIGGGKAFPIKVDGTLGPETNSAVKKFNNDYRNVPGDGEFITEGTLSSMSISSSATPAEVILRPSLPSDGRPAKGWSQPQPDKMSPAISPDAKPKWPAWQTALAVAGGGFGLVLLSTGIYFLVRK